MKHIPVLLLMCLCLAGCGESLPMGYVTGMVTLDGKPVPAGVVVTFSPQFQNSSSSSGVTKADGSYEANFSFSRKGVLIGTHNVSFSLIDTDGPKPNVKIPEKYRESYGAPVEVKQGKQKFDFALVSE